MKQIALMGLMAAVLAVGVYSCSGGAGSNRDGGAGDAWEVIDGNGSSDGGEPFDAGGPLDAGLPDTMCNNWVYDQWKAADDTVASFTDLNPCNENNDCTSLATGTSCNPNCSVVVSVSTYDKKKAELDKVSATYCTKEMIQACGTSGIGCADGGMPVCINGQCGRGDHWVGDAGYDGSTDPDAPNDGGMPDSGPDGGTDAGTVDIGIVVTCGPSPTGKGGDMCDVPAGPFMMGCNEAVDTDCLDDEKPYHEVTVPTFKVDKYEVTTGEYQTCVDAGDCSAAATGRIYCNSGVTGKESHPINCVDWIQASTYCTWAGKRLPTEAEWEKATRGTDGRKYPWGNTSPDCVHAVMSAKGCSNSGTALVGSKPLGVSPYGTEDMIGNVMEWVVDWYHDTYMGAPSDGSPWLTPTSATRVLRGESWNITAISSLRASSRVGDNPSDSYFYYGFRCAWSQ